MKQTLLALLMLLYSHLLSAQEYTFGVLPQRSAQLTAEYWNPILDYVSQKSGVMLTMKTARTGTESRDQAIAGAYHFIYTNHIFQPKVAAAGYQVILRPNAADFTSEIVVLQDSPIQTLSQLHGQAVGFASKAAFVGYWVPMDQLLRQKLSVEAIFGGNQEGIIAQLKAGRVAAIGVNSRSMKAYAQREGIAYRSLWTSASYHEIPIAAHPKVAQSVVNAVQNAFDNMDKDPEGQMVLAASAAVINEKPPFGFQKASPKDYQDQTDFYLHTLVTESD
jgi:phosphonate transport system substrate-binding protein